MIRFRKLTSVSFAIGAIWTQCCRSSLAMWLAARAQMGRRALLLDPLRAAAATCSAQPARQLRASAAVRKLFTRSSDGAAALGGGSQKLPVPLSAIDHGFVPHESMLPRESRWSGRKAMVMAGAGVLAIFIGVAAANVLNHNNSKEQQDEYAKITPAQLRHMALHQQRLQQQFAPTSLAAKSLPRSGNTAAASAPAATALDDVPLEVLQANERRLAQLHSDARSIFQAALDAADSKRMVERCLSIQHIGSPEDQASSARSLVVQVAPGRSVAYSLDYFCRIVVVGAGKAAVSMAAGVETVLLEHAPDALKGGVVVTKYGHVAGGPPLRRIRALEAAHPVPDEASVNATNEVVRLLDAVSDDSRTLVVVLISGGGSSLWSAPEPGLGLADLQATNQALLGSGMPIAGMNLIRKHVDQLKGGGLLRRAGQAQVLSLVLSDVIGDDLSTIASGPTVPFERDFVQTLAELDKFNLRPSRAQREQERRVAPRDGDAGAFPLRVYEHLLQGAMKQRSTDQPAVPSADAKGVPLLDRDSRIPSLSLDAASSGPALSNVTNVLVGSNLHSLRAAARRATELGYDAQVLTDRLDGEAATAGQWLARAAIPALGAANVAAPAASSARAWIAGGETTVTFHTSQQQQQPSGLGGRTQELALAGALALAQHESPASPRGCRTVLLAGGSDGTDGPTDATGAVVDAMTVSRAARSGLDAADFLRRHDSYTFFDRLDQAAAAASSSSTSSAPKAPLPPAHLKPGPTGTNVGDVMLVLQK